MTWVTPEIFRVRLKEHMWHWGSHLSRPCTRQVKPATHYTISLTQTVSLNVLSPDFLHTNKTFLVCLFVFGSSWRSEVLCLALLSGITSGSVQRIMWGSKDWIMVTWVKGKHHIHYTIFNKIFLINLVVGFFLW